LFRRATTERATKKLQHSRSGRRGAILIVIITILGPISGAHFNPAVTLVFASRGEFQWSEVTPYVVVQCLGGICGTVVAHLMFDLAPLAIGITGRSGPSQWLAEAVATFTLVLAILGGIRYAPSAIPWLVGLTITAAYWFTASTSFANPAVTLARGFTTTFAGIAINHVPAFIAAQLVLSPAPERDAAFVSNMLARARKSFSRRK
jgi:glycerol uptake facilitator-like aquaporin